MRRDMDIRPPSPQTGIMFGIGIAAAALTAFFPPSAELIRLFFIAVVLLSHAHLLGISLIPRLPWAASIVPGTVFALAIQTVTQTAWYYAGGHLGNGSDAASLAVVVIFTYAAALFTNGTESTEEKEEKPPRRFLFAPAFLIPAILGSAWILRAAAMAGTTESIRTPWPLIRPGTLFVVAVLWALLILSALIVRSRAFAALHAIVALVPTLSLANLIYKIGYGFDGFLHVASEKIILATGTLSPKPLYYIGQYAFTTWLARLSHFQIADVDRWLLPTIAALLLPTAIACILPRTRTAAFAFLGLALLPIGAFIATTPQGLAYLLGLAAILFAIGVKTAKVHPLAALTVAAWSICVHPLAGIPLLFVTFAVLAGQLTHPVVARGLQTISVLLAGLSVPLMFLAIGSSSGTGIAWNLDAVLNAKPWLERLAGFIPMIGNRFVLWPAWASLAERALPIILLIVAIFGWIAERKEKNGRTVSPILIASAVGLWIAGTALQATGDFTFLIDYERGNYADRLNTLALLCLIPGTLFALPWIAERIVEKTKTAKTASVVFLSGGIVIGLLYAIAGLTYDSLPRHDALVTGRGWSTSRQHLDAVASIDRDADGRAYTVMADQSVSAAAVSLLGFKRYADDVFFYPIPTGGPLYETYLRMTYDEPSLDTVKDAARLGKTDLVYVVVNDYWWRAAEVSEAIDAIADKSWTIGNGKTNVYAFDLNTPSNASTTESGR